MTFPIEPTEITYNRNRSFENSDTKIFICILQTFCLLCLKGNFFNGRKLETTGNVIAEFKKN